jgi:hypothetical protein
MDSSDEVVFEDEFSHDRGVAESTVDTGACDADRPESVHLRARDE